MKYVMFNQVGAHEFNSEDLGHKAKNLMELFSIGFDVPMGLVMVQCPTDFSELSNLVKQIGGFPLAVRSSGALEDLEGAGRTRLTPLQI